MNIVRLLCTAMLISLGAHNAMALSIDDKTATNNDGSAKFGDPDDKIPFPHVADDGTPPNNLQSGGFQAQPVGSAGLSIGFSASHDSGASAFQRAQENQRQ